MLPYVHILGRQVPAYGLLGVTGFAAGLVVALLLARHFRLDAQDCVFIWAFGGVGGVIGAKLLYLLTIFPQLSEALATLAGDPLAQGEFLLEILVSGGLVFYGAVAGALVAAVLYARYAEVSLASYLPALVPAFPLFHAIARVGCFCAGCCYGVEASWGIAFTEAVAGPNGVPLVPVQLFEAGLELLIFVVLLAYVLSAPRDPLRVLGLYLTLYAPTRFVLEFWRGDLIRGIFWGLSTSQWLSIAILVAGVVLLVRGRDASPRVEPASSL